MGGGDTISGDYTSSGGGIISAGVGDTASPGNNNNGKKNGKKRGKQETKSETPKPNDQAVRNDFGNYKFKDGIDIDLRGKGSYKDALEMAFKRTSVPKNEFVVTKWGVDKYGKSFPVEWRTSNGAEVSIDLGHSLNSGAPTVPHIGWQTGGKRGAGGGIRGHVFVDEVPCNR